MVRRLALAAALAAAFASPPLFDTLWSWAASLVQEEAPAPPTTTPQPTSDDDKGYGIDPNG